MIIRRLDCSMDTPAFGKRSAVRSRLYQPLLVLLAAQLAGCGWFGPGPLDSEQFPTLREAQRPVTEARQTVNLAAPQAWQTLLGVLSEKGIGVAESDEAKLRLVSDWVPMSDSHCGVYPSEGAPLPCKTRYTAVVQPLSPVASALQITYLEECTERTEFVLECPGSNAERLMMQVVETFKAKSGVVDIDDF